VSPTRRVTILLAGIALLGVTAFVLPLKSIPSWVAGLGVLAPIAGVSVGAALLMALVPRTPISVACGLLFGAGAGIACAVAVGMIAAAATFATGRWLGRDFVAHRAGRRWVALERWIAREGVLAVAAVRAVPLGPYGLIGYAYGTSNVRVRDYALGTLISGTPSAVTYAWLGAAIAGPAPTSPITFVPLALALMLAAVVLVRTRRHLPGRPTGG
jgi:uncharacterized membrane protein YdjX (TVP38/TMEM64 family)